MFEKGTHFNPVDLVCAVRDYKGHKFDLVKYVDKATGFISYKSKNGKDLKALELPGLWNGAMSDWNTVFVEVPLTTFNPVKNGERPVARTASVGFKTRLGPVCHSSSSAVVRMADTDKCLSQSL